MPRRIEPLTEQQLIHAEPGDKPFRLFDGYGLYVEVMPTGSKIWRMKFRQKDGKENALTFGHYPEVSPTLARCRRAVARQMLHDGLDPRTEFDAAHMRSPKPVRRHCLLPVAMDDRKVERCVSQVGRQALERLHGLVFPALSRVEADESVRSDMQAMLEKIQKERSVEVIDLLYDYCADIVFGCLGSGIDEDDLIEAMRDARVAQRRK
ncbi:DUF4102 domain-containing protein [Janthinobacterium sp. GW460P]|nr:MULTISPECIES: DUF4102 domain-containing protein [unclassified Janthinobacterium]MCC7701655.1 DUF4102 domain-containing protein [Janthinobacterium sp. GW460P]MCC7707162.1 DUF4102 domain-containing protein [Janthinobacterium sp. GW460W]